MRIYAWPAVDSLNEGTSRGPKWGSRVMGEKNGLHLTVNILFVDERQKKPDAYFSLIRLIHIT